MDFNGKIQIMLLIKHIRKIVGFIEIFLLLKGHKQEDRNFNSRKLKEWKYNLRKYFKI